MSPLQRIDWEILDSTADDWENLEQIFFSVCFEVVRLEAEPQCEPAHALRRVQEAVLLSEIADRIATLTEGGLLAARHEESGVPVSDLTDRSFVWRAWFRMTPSGKAAWDSSEHATLAEQGQPQ
jgi:hypothetical protein